MAFVRERTGLKGTTYQVRYYLEGKEKVKTFESKREANKFRKEIEAKINLGIAKDESNVIFSEYAEMVFKIRDRKAESITKKNRLGHLKVINNRIGHLKLKDITATRIENFFAEMSESKSDQTLLKYRQVINIVLDFAFTKDLIVVNPMLKVRFDISQENINEVLPVKKDDFNNYVSHIGVKKYYFVLMLAMYTGMRIGEVLAIHHSDFDYNTNLFNITKSQKTNMKIGLPKKGKKRKGIIHEKLAELHYEIQTWQNQYKKILGDEYNDNNLVICHEDGKPISYSALIKYLLKIDDEVKYKIRPHQLRHTFISSLQRMKPKDLQLLSGHDDFETTLSYTHFEGFDDEVTNMLNDVFKN